MNIEEIKQLQLEYHNNVSELVNQLHSLTSNNIVNNEFVEKINTLTSKITNLRYRWYEQSRDIVGRMFETLVNDEYNYGDSTVMVVVDSSDPKYVDVDINLFKPLEVRLCKSNWDNDEEDDVLEEMKTNDLVEVVCQIIALGGMLLERT